MGRSQKRCPLLSKKEAQNARCVEFPGPMGVKCISGQWQCRPGDGTSHRFVKWNCCHKAIVPSKCISCSTQDWNHRRQMPHRAPVQTRDECYTANLRRLETNWYNDSADITQTNLFTYVVLSPTNGSCGRRQIQFSQKFHWRTRVTNDAWKTAVLQH